MVTKKKQQRQSSLEGILMLCEDDLTKVTGGYAVSQQEADRLAQERGPIVSQSTGYNGMPVTKFANGQTIVGRML